MGKAQESDETPLLSQERKVSWCHFPTWAEVVTAMVVGLSYLWGGFGNGYSSPTTLPLQEQGLLNSEQAPWYGSLFSLGHFSAAALAGYMADRLGRKVTLMLFTLPVIGGWMCIICARNYKWLLAGRVITGAANGIHPVAMMYVTETSSRRFRGTFGTLTYAMSPIGTVVIYAAALGIDWQWLALISMIPAVLLIVAILPIPDTPRWYMRNGQPDKALEVLCWLRHTSESDKELMQEYSELKKETERKITKVTLSELYIVRKQLFIAVMLAVFQQMTGVAAIIFYTDSIFESSGYRGNPGIPSLIFASVKAGVSVMFFFLADQFGRKATLTIGALGMAISHAALGTYFYLFNSNENINTQLSWLPLASIVIFAMFYGISWGCLTYLVVAEIFPLSMRGFGSSVKSATSSLFSFIVSLAFLPLEEAIGAFGVFWFLGGMCAIAAAFCWLLLTETKGKYLEMLQKLYIAPREVK